MFCAGDERTFDMTQLIVRLMTAATGIVVALSCVDRAMAQSVYVAEYYNERVTRYDAGGANLGLFASLTPSGARFYGMAVDSTGRLYVGANGGGGGFQGVRRFAANGTFLGSISGSNDGAVAVGANDELFVGNYGSGQITRYAANGTSLGLFATAPAGLAGMKFDTSGNLFTVAEDTSVRKFSASGQDLGVFVGGQSKARDLAFDAAGNLLVVNRGNATVRRYSPTGQDLGVYASSANGLTDPTGIAVDLTGSVYVANHSSGGTTTVRKFSASGQDLGTFATGAALSSVATYRPIGGAVAVPEASALSLLTLTGIIEGAGIVRRRSAAQ